MYDVYGKSLPPKITLMTLHLSGIIFVFWFLILGGYNSFNGLFGLTFNPGGSLRAWIIIICAVIYFARINITMFYLMKRVMDWSEAFTIAVWVLIIHLTFAFMAAHNTSKAGAEIYIGLAFFFAGSYINTGSEMMRKKWKANPANKGKLYGEGFFKYSMHPNYFGDLTLFSGYALVTGNPFAFIIPVIMFCIFAFVNMPMLDKHMADHYKGQFEDYAARTKKLIPFVW